MISHPFKTLRFSLWVLLLGFLFFRSPAAEAALLNISFDDLATFNAQFPTSSRVIAGGSSTVTLSGGFVTLYAQAATNTPASAAIYTDVSYSPNFDFISQAATFTFNSVTFNVSSGGSTYKGNFGVTSSNNGIMGTSNAVYFRINRSNTSLELVQSIAGTATTLYAWPAASINYGYDNLGTVSLTLTGTGWSVAGTAIRKGDPTKTASLSASGTFDSAWTASTWGSEFYLGLDAEQTTADSARWAQLLVGGVSVQTVPEPSATALALGGLVCVMLLGAAKSRLAPGVGKGGRSGRAA